MAKPDLRVERLEVSAYTIPTDQPEADGTYHWDKTTMVLVEAFSDGMHGYGYTYGAEALARLIDEKLAKAVIGGEAMDVPGAWAKMVYEIRNLGRPGICSMAIAAVDCALWDLKARLLRVPLVSLFGAAHAGVKAYGSGGFTTYSTRQLQKQLGGWAADGFQAVKMKIGTNPEEDLPRVRAARKAIGDGVALYVDANGAYTRKQALEKAFQFADLGVTWFEEPVPEHDHEGLALMRERAPAGMNIASGEYGYDLPYYRGMLERNSVDVLQADVTRCGGFTDFRRVDALCAAFEIPFSAHTAPTEHTHVCCASPQMFNVEYFHDHARIESMLFDGAIKAYKGVLRPDLSRAGMGFELKRSDAEKYKTYSKSSGGKS